MKKKPKTKERVPTETKVIYPDETKQGPFKVVCPKCGFDIEIEKGIAICIACNVVCEPCTP